MHAKDSLRVNPHQAGYGTMFATITTISGGKVTRLYTTPTHLDEKSLNGWVKDFKRALRDVRCIWCGDPAEYVTEVDDLDIYGFCSEEDYTAALAESEAMSLTDDGGI